MKKLLQITAVYFALVAFNPVSAQIVNIPDNNFQIKLLNANTSNNIAKDINGNNIKVDVNEDGEIQEIEALNVYELSIYNSSIADLTGIEAFTNLTLLGVSHNDLSTIDLSNNPNLEYFNCSSNDLTMIDLSNNSNIYHLDCGFNNLTTIDLSNNSNIYYLDCGSNNLTTIDLSNNPNIYTLWLYDNPNLTTLNLHNGTLLNTEIFENGSWSEMWNLPDNVYICADEEEISIIGPYLNTMGSSGQVISSACSFLPAGDYNTIKGVVYSDWDNNGCDDDEYILFSQVKVEKDDDYMYSYTNDNGEYIFFTNDGTFNLSIGGINPDWFTVTPEDYSIVFDAVDGSISEQDFCVTPNGNHPDLEIIITQLFNAVPGFQASYKIVYRNIGNQLMSGEYGINLFFDDNLMDFVSADVTPESTGTGALSWSYENLKPFESREIIVNMAINTPTDPDFPVEIDDELTFTVSIFPVSGDENPLDNTFIYNQTVVGSYDPNDITCLEGKEVGTNYIGEDLHYLVRFENTGTDVAHNIVVIMDINEDYYNPDSLDILRSSHDVDVRLHGNTAEMYFNDIMLETSGHGNILLALETRDTLEENDFVISKVDIYFDFNYPITTNDAQTTFLASLSIVENTENINLNIYPNPAKDKFTISAKSKIHQIEIFDMTGKLIKISTVNDNESVQDINYLSNGVYLMKVKTNDGNITARLVKE